MTIPIITNSEIPFLPTSEVVLIAIRDSISAAGFGNTNYDAWDDLNWVVKYVWDASKPKGFIYLHFFVVTFGSGWNLYAKTYLTWDLASHSGEGGSQQVSLDLSYVTDSPSFKLKITAINHPELKGFIWQQEDRFGSLYFARPAVVVEGYGYDDINFSWCFLVSSDWNYLYQGAGALNNPFRDGGSLRIESSDCLKYKIPETGVAQIAPSPRIIAPDNSGFVGWFSADIGLCSSYGLEWKTPLRDGAKNYLLLRPKDSSGPTIATN